MWDIKLGSVFLETGDEGIFENSVKEELEDSTAIRLATYPYTGSVASELLSDGERE